MKKEGVLSGCFKDVIKRDVFENYCEVFEIEDRKKMYDELKERGYKMYFESPIGEE